MKSSGVLGKDLSGNPTQYKRAPLLEYGLAVANSVATVPGRQRTGKCLLQVALKPPFVNVLPGTVFVAFPCWPFMPRS
jgi:hypothetical protein